MEILRKKCRKCIEKSVAAFQMNNFNPVNIALAVLFNLDASTLPRIADKNDHISSFLY